MRPVCSSQKQSAKSGFTLIELLVVISIISLLISILLPALRAARDVSRSAACMSQLKQIQLAAAMYATEHNDIVPGWNYLDPAASSWDHSMARYLNIEPNMATVSGRNIGIYQCPQSTTEFDMTNQNASWWGGQVQTTYNMSYLSSCSRANASPNSNDDHYGKYQYLKQTRLAAPSEFVLFADALPGGTLGPLGTVYGYHWYFEKLFLSWETTNTAQLHKMRMLSFRHMSTSVFVGEDPNAKLNASFLDGHVKNMDMNAFADTNATAKNFKSLGYRNVEY